MSVECIGVDNYRCNDCGEAFSVDAETPLMHDCKVVNLAEKKVTPLKLFQLVNSADDHPVLIVAVSIEDSLQRYVASGRKSELIVQMRELSNNVLISSAAVQAQTSNKSVIKE